MRPKQSKCGRRFDEEFKREVAALASQPGATIERVASDLGVSAHSVARWRRRLRAENGGAPSAAVAASVIPRLAPALSAAELGARSPRPAPGGGRAAPAARDPKKKPSPSSRFPRAEDGGRRTTLAGQFPVRALCRALGVSRSAFCAATGRPARPRAREDARLWVKIITCLEASRGTYGSPRVAAALRRAGGRCSRHRVARIMRGRGLRAKQKRRFRPATTDSGHLCPIAPDRPAGRPTPGGPRSGLGGRSDLPPHRRGLALPRRRARSLQPQDRRLGGRRHDGHHPGRPCAGAGRPTAPARPRALAPLGIAAASMPATLTASFHTKTGWSRAGAARAAVTTTRTWRASGPP